MKVINLSQNTPEWQEYRKSHFNASEVSALFGCGFYDELTLAHIKYGTFEPYQNRAMKKGSEVEADNRSVINKDLSANFTPIVCAYENDERFSASLDGFDKNTGEILELKFSTDEYAYVLKNGKPSKKYYLQVQHQLLCSGAKKCVFATFEPFGEYAMCEVLPDIEKQNEIIDKWLEFEKKYQGKELPPLEQNFDGTSANADIIGAIVDEAVALKAQISALQDELKEKESYLKNIAGNTKTRFFNQILYYPTIRQIGDYKSYFKDSNLTLPPEYVKKSVSWALKYNENKC